MKILFLNGFYPPHVGGGAELILQRSVEGLQARGIDVTVLVTSPKAGLHQDTVNGIKVYRAGLRNLYWHYTEQRPGRFARLAWHIRDRYNGAMREPLRQILQQEQPDLVVCHNLSGWSISAWDEIKAAGIPIVQVLHDMYLLCPKNTLFNKGRSCAKRCTSCNLLRQPHASASSHVDAVVGVSKYLLEKIVSQGYFPTAPQYVIHNSSLIEGSTRQQMILDSSQPLRFGYMGTLSENKGVAWLIEQFQNLNLNATLSIAGRGQLDYEHHLKALADPARVQFVGYQKPDEFYPTIDVSIVPSLWAEPFGMVAVEACAFQVPVIATRMGGLPEIVKEGINGLLCDAQDPSSLGRTLQRIHDDDVLRRQLSLLARTSVADLLSMDSMLDKYQAVFEQVLGRYGQTKENVLSVSKIKLPG